MVPCVSRARGMALTDISRHSSTHQSAVDAISCHLARSNSPACLTTRERLRQLNFSSTYETHQNRCKPSREAFPLIPRVAIDRTGLPAHQRPARDSFQHLPHTGTAGGNVCQVLQTTYLSAAGAALVAVGLPGGREWRKEPQLSPIGWRT